MALDFKMNYIRVALLNVLNSSSRLKKMVLLRASIFKRGKSEDQVKMSIMYTCRKIKIEKNPNIQMLVFYCAENSCLNSWIKKIANVKNASKICCC